MNKALHKKSVGGKMKIKDLPKNTELGGMKIKIPKKYEDTYQGIKGEMFIFSSWQKGVWLKKKMDADRIYPMQLDKLKDLLEFTIVRG